MKPPVDTLRLGKRSRDHLTKLKRQSGIAHWNTICRWALCVSLAEKTPPPRDQDENEGGVEIPWKIFAGDYGDVLTAALYLRMHNEGIAMSDTSKADQFRNHVARGLGYLASGNGQKTIETIIQRATR